MKPEIYKEVKIYDWKSYSKPQRETVHTNASAAFDRLGLGPDAPERDILMPERIKRASPPLVAEGSHVVGNMDTKWRPGAGAGAAAGGGGSESEGFEKNSLLKSGTTKKPLVKKQQGTSQSSKKSLKGSTNGSKGTRQPTSTILEVANHSKGATTPTSTLKSGAGGTPSVGVGSPTVPIRRTSISNGSGNGNGTTNNSGGSNGHSHGHGHGHSGSTSSLKRPLESSKKSSSKEGSNGYKIPKVGSATSVSKKPLGKSRRQGKGGWIQDEPDIEIVLGLPF